MMARTVGLQFPSLLLPSVLLAATLFLLSADHLFVGVAGQKVKVGYFLILGAWLFAPAAMLAAVKDALSRIPRYAWVPLLPLTVSVAASVNLRDSIAWTLWLAFDLFTIATIYAFLKAHAFSGNQVRTCVAWSLAGITFFAVLQFVAIYGFHLLLFAPQHHFGIYRINGISGWPHFLNIFSFLLLPIVLVQRRLRWYTALLLTLLMFMLVQSTAKTGWVLFVVLGGLLLLLDRRVFVKSYLWFLLPVTIVALLIPTPPYGRDASRQGALPGPAGTVCLTGSEKISKFAADLNLGDITTSGTDRMLINRQGLAVWWKNPWFGIGPRTC